MSSAGPTGSGTRTLKDMGAVGLGGHAHHVTSQRTASAPLPLGERSLCLTPLQVGSFTYWGRSASREILQHVGTFAYWVRSASYLVLDLVGLFT